MINLKDIYGDHGLVSLVVLKKYTKILYVESFIMSCRIMGRYLENWILEKIKKIAFQNKIKNIVFEFIPNKKNKDLINQFIKVNNFKKIKKNDLINMEERLKHIKKSNKNTEYYTININQKIKNIEIYG